MPAINPQTSVFTPAWSRKLGAAFRSPVTTLSRHNEVIAPDLRLRFHAKFRFRSADSELPRSVWFRSHNRGAIFVPNLLPAPSFGAPMIVSGPHSPSGLFGKPSGSKRSAGILTKSPPCDSPDGLPLPATLFFNRALDRRSKPAVFRSAIVPSTLELFRSCA
jgi:hypothetical protein